MVDSIFDRLDKLNKNSNCILEQHAAIILKNDEFISEGITRSANRNELCAKCYLTCPTCGYRKPITYIVKEAIKNKEFDKHGSSTCKCGYVHEYAYSKLRTDKHKLCIKDISSISACMDALTRAYENKIDLNDTVLYINVTPNLEDAVHIIEHGIKEVVIRSNIIKPSVLSFLRKYVEVNFTLT